AVEGDQLPVLHGDTAPPLGDVLYQYGVKPVEREVHQFEPGGVYPLETRDRERLGVVGVEHQRPAIAHTLGYQRLDPDQVIEVLDAVLPQVVGRDVGDDRHVGPVVAETSAQEAAARR